MSDYFEWPVINNAASVSDIISREFARKLNLEFVVREHETNLCFIESDELRDEYRTTITTSDILNYNYAMTQRSNSNTYDHEFPEVGITYIPYPKDGASFWRLVRLGKQLKKTDHSDSHLVDQLIKEIDRVMS